MKRKILLNSFSGVVQVIINIGLLTLTIPIFINKLGMTTYGIYALITAVGSIGVFTNFGFNTSLIKYLAEQSDHRESNYDIVVTFLIIGLATSLIALFALIFHDFILLHILGLTRPAVSNSVRWLYYTCITTNIFQMLNQIPSAILDSQQKIYITNTIQISTGIFSKCMILAVLFVSPDLAAIGWIILLSSMITFFTLSWFSYKVWGKLSCPELGKWLIPITKKHFKYGRTIYAASIMNLFYEPFTKVLLNRYLGLVEVGYFDLALKIRLLVNSVLDKLLYPVFPLIAQISDIIKIRQIIKEIQQKLILLLIPIIILAVFIIKPIITLWIGKNVALISFSVIVVVTSNLISILYQPVYMYLTAKGYPQKILVLQSVNVATNIIIFCCIVPYLGYTGALMAYCFALLSSVTLCAYYQWKYLKSMPIDSVHQLSGIIKLVITLFIANTIMSSLSSKEWILICLSLLTNIISTILVVRSSRMIDKNDLSRYVGKNNIISNVLSSLFIRENVI